MGRPRQYASDAERQRAYRCRQEASIARVDRRALDQLHARLEQLQRALWRAADAGDATARACQAASIDTMLERLIRQFDGRAAQRSQDDGSGIEAAARPGKGGRRRKTD